MKRTNYYSENRKCQVCGIEIGNGRTFCRKHSRELLVSVKECKSKEKEIIDLYNSGETSMEISKYLKVSQMIVLRTLKENDIPVHSLRKHEIKNETIFDIESPEKYYLLGFFASDGAVGKNRGSKFVSLSANKKDIILLKDICSILGTEKPLTFGKDDCYKLDLYSSKLYDDLVSYGVEENKSLKLKITKEIPDNYLKFFLRGMFDGDGSITGTHCADIAFCYSASKDMAEQLVSMYKRIGADVNLYYYDKGRKNGIYVVKKGGVGGLNILAEMYSGGGPFSPRKYLKFLNFVRLSLDEVMMESAYLFSKRSSCMRAKVGCVITNEERTNIISIGYNGGAAGEENCCESSLPGKCGCIHAEQNALIKGVGSILYCTTLPCKQCAKLIINAGIKKVYFGDFYRDQAASQFFTNRKISLNKISREDYLWKLKIAEKLGLK